MEAHSVNHSIAIMPIWFVVMLVLGALVVVGFVLAARQKRSPGPLVGVLAGGTVACFVFLMTFGHSVTKVRQATVDAQQAELQQRLELLGAELHQHATIAPIPIADHSVPAEAPRPSASAVAVARSGKEVSQVTAPTPLPDWVLTLVSTEDDRKLVVVRSEQFADPATAASQALQEATELVLRNFDEFNHLGRSSWTLDPQTVRSAAVRRTFTESINRSAGEHDFTVYRTYLLVELSPSVRDQIEPIWREQISKGRSLVVMVLLVLATAFAGVIAGYFRLDERTGGKHRWALRAGSMATLLLITAGLGVAGTRTTRTIHSDPPETSAPSVAPPVQVIKDDVRVDHETEERFVEVADRIVSAINSADYEGMRTGFNETMREKFPVERCRDFFDGRITGIHGKVRELEPPDVRSPAVAVFVAHCERGALNFTLVLDDEGQVAGLLFKPRPALPSLKPVGDETRCGTRVDHS